MDHKTSQGWWFITIYWWCYTLYVIWITNKIDIQTMNETHWWSAFSPLFSEFCLCSVNMLICVLSAYEWLHLYFCHFCWSLQSYPQHLEVSTEAVYALTKYSFLYNYIHKKRFEALFCLLPIYILADNCFEILKCVVISPSWNLQITSLH
jgi:hypothetical protein